MALQSKSMKRLAVAGLVTAGMAVPAFAFDDLTTRYSAQLLAAESQRLPATYKIVRNTSRKPARISNRYLGGKVRVIYLDGRAVRMTEGEIVENTRAGHFVPVYQDTGKTLSKEDWVLSLPGWLGSATLAAAR